MQFGRKAKGTVFPLVDDIVHGVWLEEGFVKVHVVLISDVCDLCLMGARICSLATGISITTL